MRRNSGLIFISTLLGFIFLLFYLIGDTSYLMVNIERGILLLSVLIFFVSLQYDNKKVSLIYLFLFSTTLFLLGRVILSVFDDKELYDSNKYVFYTMHMETVSKVLCLIGTSLSFSVVGFCTYSEKNRHNRTYQRKVFFPGMEQYWKVIMYITIPLCIYKQYVDLSMIRIDEYLSIYTQDTKSPLIAKAGWWLFSTLFPVGLLFINCKRDFFRMVGIYAVANFFNLITGSRSSLLVPILFFTWYYYTFITNKDIHLLYIIIGIVLIAYIAEWLLTLREGVFQKNGVIKMLLETQGVQYVFLGNYLDMKDQFVVKSHWYILFPLYALIPRLTNPVFRTGHSSEMIEQTLSLDHQLMYACNPQAYLSGAGYGSCYIAELHALGGILAVLIGSFLLGRFMAWFEKKCADFQSPYIIVLSFFIVSHIFRIARDPLFIEPISLLFPCLFLLLFQKRINPNNE
ncbi:MAG: O-antigen polysaccharide polymerase Wzy [Bacteroidales bacterium]|nr:O-antigen polysaccharide polymerase Wzy [Bacteroidales bacterium]